MNENTYRALKNGIGIIDLYIPPFVVISGLIGNVLSFAIMIRRLRGKRTSSTTVYMAALAVVDSIILIFPLSSYWMYFNFLKNWLTDQVCRGFTFIMYAFINYSSWLVVGMTADRYVAVRWTFKVARYCTTKRAALAIALIGTIVIGLNIYPLFTMTVALSPKTNRTVCRRTGYSPVFDKFMSIFDLAFHGLLPIIALTVLNALILSIYSRTKAEMKKITGPRTVSVKNDIREKSEKNQLTKMLLLVSAAYIALNVPIRVYRFVETVYPLNKNIDSEVISQFVYAICHKLWYANCAVNFYLYCIGGGKSFRRDLKRLFTRDSTGMNSRDYSDQENASIVSKRSVAKTPSTSNTPENGSVIDIYKISSM
ncbi:thyrotropin-releasing hormone receptor-like [Tubulanus polymorphus]|uniref:thyrotropin-releasing hormone receptor-like n=1 Tax=Tubulanus polymorphus TaxID=672921 RepID=UPI003DA3E9A1